MTLEVLTSDLLAGTRHGFFTRRGGASSGIYAGLNCGPGSSDQREAVALNRARVAEALGVDPARLLSLHQVHGTDVAVAGREGWTERPRADAAVTADPAVALGVLTADCAPVLFHDPEAGVIGAAHAGWRGALDGVARGDARRHGAPRRPPRDGPRRRRPDHQPARLRGRPRVPRPVPRRRRTAPSASSPPARATASASTSRASSSAACAPPASREAEWIGACTYSDPERFFSYRRATRAGEPDYGRLISAIRL